MSGFRLSLRKVTPRRVAVFFGVFASVLVAGSAVAFADDPKPTPTQNFGESFGSNDISGGQARTLYETYGSSNYRIPIDVTAGDAIAALVNGLTDFLLDIVKSIVAAIIQLTTWLFDMGDTSEISNGIAPMIGTTSGTLMLWLFPTAIAAGALVAFVQGTRDGAGATMGQIAWVVVGGLLTTSLAVTPVLWTQTVESVRTAAVDAVNGATADALSTNASWPVPIDEPSFEGQDSKTVMKRKIADALQRNLVAMPWCMSTFGSIEACQKYGRGMLDQGGDNDKMKKYISDTMMGPEGGDKSSTIRFTKGHDYWPRLGQAAVVCLVAVFLALVIVVLGFGAFACIVLSWLLLVVGAFFAMLWVIPGPTREWGKNWFLALIGSVAGAVVKMLVFQAVLLITIVVLNSSWNMGIRLVAAIAVALAGIGLNRTLEHLVNHSGMGFMRTAAMGFMAGRAARGVMRGAGRAAMGTIRGGRTAGTMGRGLMSELKKMGADPRRQGQGGQLQDMGERRKSFRPAGALTARRAPVGALPAGTSTAGPEHGGAPSPQLHALPAGDGQAKSRHGVAFQGEMRARPLPQRYDNRPEGKRPMRVNPTPEVPHDHGRTHGVPVGLPRGPQTHTPRKGSGTGPARSRSQFRAPAKPITISGETAGPDRPSRSAAPRTNITTVPETNKPNPPANRSRTGQDNTVKPARPMRPSRTARPAPRRRKDGEDK